jgi:glycerol kinase
LQKHRYICAIDQGTTSTRCVIMNRQAQIISFHQLPHKQLYPKPGWVEHDPAQIIENTYQVIQNALEKGGIQSSQLAAIGITNQRETTVVWDRFTGVPLHNAIVWQDTRTSDICSRLAGKKDPDYFRKKTGLPVATYFSGPKIKWLIDNIPEVNQAVHQKKAFFGNMDTWLIWWLTGGPEGGVHVTDVTNASRTLLMNLETLNWDQDLLDILKIPARMLPEIKSSSEIYGYTASSGVFGDKIPVAGDFGDQQAALFGQACFDAGDAKNTYGTGCFLLINSGEKIIQSKHGLITTVGYKIGTAPATYALEGSIAMAGSLVQWVRDNLGMIQTSADIEKLAQSVQDNGGIYFVPAFSGLFAPHWDSSARGLIIGLTHMVNKGHIARAVIEATAFQTKEIFDAMKKDSGVEIPFLKVDGGMVANTLLMQFQADMLDIPIVCQKTAETTVLGAAYAAGLGVGFWQSLDELKSIWKQAKQWLPNMSEEKRSMLFKGWQNAVKRTHNWMN